MAELAWRDSWVWALLLYGLFGLLSPDPWSSLVGLLLLGAWALERRALRRTWSGKGAGLPSGRGAQTVLAGALMILAGLLHLGHVGALRPPTTPESVQSLLRLLLAAVQLVWTALEIRRFRRELERAE